MDDIDVLHGKVTGRMKYDVKDREMRLIMGRLDYLCPDADGEMGAYMAAVSRLSACFGCLTGAINYVHDQRIRHKDVKPHNVLLSYDGLWLADFGISSDFSELSTSQSEAIERGTARYFAPEVAIYDRSGRAADIFSLGCIFLEMLALIQGVPLVELRSHRPEERGSFQGNLQHRQSWFKLLRTRNAQLQHLLCEIENMIEEEPRLRPSARMLDRHLSVISRLGKARSAPLHGPCCTPEQLEVKIAHMRAEIYDLKLGLRDRDHYIDNLLASNSSSESEPRQGLPRPPMGPNLRTMFPTSEYFETLV